MEPPGGAAQGKMKKGNVLLKLFFVTFYVNACTFGGGYVIVTILKEKFVDEYHWIEEKEMLDLIAIAQSSPGSVAVNGAIVVGYKVAGFPGMLACVLGVVLPPMLILSLISVFYDAFCSNHYIAVLLKGMTAGVGAVILSAVYDMGKKVVKSRDWVNVAVMAASFVASYFLDVNIIFIILVAAAFGLLRTYIRQKKETAAGGTPPPDRG